MSDNVRLHQLRLDYKLDSVKIGGQVKLALT